MEELPKSREYSSSNKIPPREISEEEYQEILGYDPKSKKKRIVLVAIGFVFVIAAIVLIIEQVVIPDFDAFPIDYEDRSIRINLSPILYLLIASIGLWLVARGVLFGTDRLRENTNYLPCVSHLREQPSGDPPRIKFRTFATTRLYAALLLFTGAIINLLIFGFELTSENDTGSWLVLGGPTIFVPTSMPNLIIAFFLVIYVVISSGVIVVNQTSHFYIFEEFRGLGLAPWNTEIPKERVKGLMLTDAKLGAKFLWVVWFTIHGVLVLIEGVSLLNEFAYGQALICGTMYVVQFFIDMGAMAILVLKHQTMLQIHTDEKRYELQVSLPAATPVVRRQLEAIFNLGPDAGRQEKINSREFGAENENLDLSPGSTRDFGTVRSYTRLAVGLVFITLAALSRIFRIYIGEPARFIVILAGMIFLVKAFKGDFTSSKKPFLVIRTQESDLKLHYRWLWMDTKYRFAGVTDEDIKTESRFRELDGFDYALLVAVPFILALQAVTVLILTPISYSLYAVMALMQILGLLVIGGLLLVVLMAPVPTILVQNIGGLVQIPIPSPLRSRTGAKSSPKRWFQEVKQQIAKEPAAFRTRLVIFLLSLAVGILAGFIFIFL